MRIRNKIEYTYISTTLRHCFYAIFEQTVQKNFIPIEYIIVLIPREAEGYSVELFGLSVRLSVPPLEGSIASRLRPHLSPHNDDSYIFGNPK